MQEYYFQISIAAMGAKKGKQEENANLRLLWNNLINKTLENDSQDTDTSIRLLWHFSSGLKDITQE